MGRLSEFSKVFKELSAAFGQISNSALRGQDDIARLLDIISDQVCSACPCTEAVGRETSPGPITACLILSIP